MLWLVPEIFIADIPWQKPNFSHLVIEIIVNHRKSEMSISYPVDKLNKE